MSQQPSLPLGSNLQIPQLGFGTWQLKGTEAQQAVTTALQVGYRHIDTADAYGNHHEVGQAIKESAIPREDIWLTSKLWHSDLQTDAAEAALHRVLKELQVEYLDLYLIHWPNQVIPIKETLGAMKSFVEQGLIRTYGVSNFTTHHLQDALDAGFQPSVNQVEFHPSLNQAELKEYCDQHHIVITAYSPIAQGHDLKLPVVQEIAQRHERSASQVVLNWLRQKGIVAIPRSANEAHIRDNFACLEWELSPEEIKQLDQINEDYRLVQPNFHEFGY